VALSATALFAAGCGTGGLQVTGSAPVSYASDLTLVVGCSGRGDRAPATLLLRCNAPRSSLVHLKWTGWGLPQARATGTLVSDACGPTTAAVPGADALPAGRCTLPATVKASDLALGDQSAQYRSLTVVTGGGANRDVRRYDIDDRGPAVRR